MLNVQIVWKNSSPQVDTNLISVNAPIKDNGQYVVVDESGAWWQIPAENILYIMSQPFKEDHSN
jgi:hypothetical protein